jgi:uncharacterized RDD family membrane protein YckC
VLLDTYRSVETPEGVELGLRVAGPVVRGWAWILDLILRWIIILMGSWVLLLLGDAAQGLFMIWAFFCEWFYYVAFELWFAGQTPGKRVFDLRVVHDDGTPVGWTASVLRNLVRFADFLPLAYGFGLLSCMFSPDFKRLGDRAAGTVVVHVDGRTSALRLPKVQPVRPPVALSPEEQLALVDFARRVPMLTRARAVELGEILTPLTGADGEDSVTRALGMARWVSGER